VASTIIPTMRYANAIAMIHWLCETFGFTQHFIVRDSEGGVGHAQLTLHDGMVMLGSARDDEFGRLQATPGKLGGTTQSAYVIVPDVDSICDKARAAGAEIVREPTDEDYGGRGFSCRDPEGHLWNFGSYNPWVGGG
jgi:uncharacterized glyoxalase superfamily protein PhnB